ncbi:MAG: flotillin family protein [Candidatus Promineifilaceae bacterium]
MMSAGVLVVSIAVTIFIVFALLFVYASRVKKVGPNEALIVSGRGDVFNVVTGGRRFVIPILERADYLSLELMTIDVTTPDVPTAQGVPVTVEGVAQVKIGNDDNSIRTAAVQFLSKDQTQIKYVAHETLAGHLRAILGTLTVEKLYKDREAFAQQVQNVSGDDMTSMGMEIVSFVIKDVNDGEGYLEALGRPRIAQVKRDATIGEAEADRDATIRSAEARQKGEEARFLNETKIAESQKKYEVEKAIYQAEINRQQAEAMLARNLQENITNQNVRAEAIQIDVIAKQKQIEVQQQEVKRREQELDATIRKPAEAEEFRVQKSADAKRYQLRAEADGQADAIKRRGEADADANRALGIAEADIIRQKGLAEAEAARALGLAQAEVTREQGLAEAEATQKKAEAWENYTQAAIMQQLIDALPEVASAIAQPLAKTDRIVIVSNGGDGSGGVGASKVTQDITNIVAQVPATLEALTGVNLTSTIANLPGLKMSKNEDSAE